MMAAARRHPATRVYRYTDRVAARVDDLSIGEVSADNVI
jgi:hypothetical protein